MASAGVSGLNQSLAFFTLNWLIELIIETATYELSEYTSSFDGFPVKDIILSSWFRVEFPGNIGLPIKTYPKMQPILQISADRS